MLSPVQFGQLIVRPSADKGLSEHSAEVLRDELLQYQAFTDLVSGCEESGQDVIVRTEPLGVNGDEGLDVIISTMTQVAMEGSVEASRENPLLLIAANQFEGVNGNRISPNEAITLAAGVNDLIAESPSLLQFDA